MSLPTWQWINELLIGNHLASRIILLARPETIAFHKTPNPFYHVSFNELFMIFMACQVPFFLILVTSPISLLTKIMNNCHHAKLFIQINVPNGICQNNREMTILTLNTTQ